MSERVTVTFHERNGETLWTWQRANPSRVCVGDLVWLPHPREGRLVSFLAVAVNVIPSRDLIAVQVVRVEKLSCPVTEEEPAHVEPRSPRVL